MSTLSSANIEVLSIVRRIFKSMKRIFSLVSPAQIVLKFETKSEAISSSALEELVSSTMKIRKHEEKVVSENVVLQGALESSCQWLCRSVKRTSFFTIKTRS